mmetsp:Transcript_3536/g.9401  ORF Transcript_3536/g.9401 Transcript_3536/m.9401 type:complete len:124 (-) Transcript_3536:1963-2334(-)
MIHVESTILSQTRHNAFHVIETNVRESHMLGDTDDDDGNSGDQGIFFVPRWPMMTDCKLLYTYQGSFATQCNDHHQFIDRTSCLAIQPGRTASNTANPNGAARCTRHQRWHSKHVGTLQECIP